LSRSGAGAQHRAGGAAAARCPGRNRGRCVALSGADRKKGQEVRVMGDMVGAMAGIGIVIYLVVVAILVVPFWFIFKRTGLSPFLSLLNLIPLIGTPIAMALLAFMRWPAGESGRTSSVQDLMNQAQGGR